MSTIAVFLLLLILLALALRRSFRSRLKKQDYEQQQKHERVARFAYWKEHIEPLQRSQKGRPRDWGNRRVAVFQRDQGVCSICGKKTGDIIIRGHKFRLRNAHVHHGTPLSRGGDNSLSNLQLVCEDCHIQTHPDISFFKRKLRNIRNQRIRQNLQKLFLGPAPSVRKARGEWKCSLCEDRISPGQLYFGGRWDK
ncbi:MAG: HNH endonuclease, partial [Candidatus Tectomicrobia bacterium]|nr:HNH endonuclease [Candidatus Tectomicrobia bacterium]